jgi:sodium/proline symporter
MWSIVIGFSSVLALFLLVGHVASRQRKRTTDDYLMAGRSTHPWLVGFAAASANSSGFMFIGLIGATVKDGLSAMWLMVGWIVGDYLAWLVIHRRLRERSEELRSQSVAGYISAGYSRDWSSVRMVSGALTFVFLGTYAAAQFTAGSKGSEAVLGWPHWVGILVGFGILMLYSFAGGLRASIWVNTAQSIVMIGTSTLLLAVAVLKIGGFDELWTRLEVLDPKYVDWRPQGLRFGFAAFLASWITAGIGVIGQPHIMIIAMTIDDSESMHRARRVYFIWYWLFSAACILIGLCCRVLLNDLINSGFDPEMAMPRLAADLLSPALVGVVLGSLFAATLGGLDTMILCASSAVSQDFFPAIGRSYTGTKLSMAATATLIVLTALVMPQSVFELVVLSWSCLAVGIGPILTAQTLRWPLNNSVGTAMILAGVGTALYWKYGLKFSDSIYEVLPGMLAGFGVYGAARLFGFPARAVDQAQSPGVLAEGAEA